MGQDSKIEWTDHTFNPWWGCTHVHEGCRHCYAETWAQRFGVKWGPTGVRRVASEKQWAEPLKWNRLAQKAGVRAKVFCASMADVFEDTDIQLCHQSAPEIKMWKMNEPNGHDWQWGAGVVLDDPSSGVPLTLDDVRKRLFSLIDQTPWLDWQLVTKRPENIQRMTPAYAYHACETGDCPHDRQSECASDDERKYRDNVWLLTSVSDQDSADKQIPDLLKCRALSPVLGLSVEPLLGPIRLDRLNDGSNGWIDCLGGVWGHGFSSNNQGDGTEEIPDGTTGNQIIDWVIVGGESGQHARPVHPEWVRSLRDQCAHVPFFFKQWGEWAPLHGTSYPHGDEEDEGPYPWTWISTDGELSQSGSRPDAVMQKVGKTLAGRILDGRTWDEFPEVIHA